MAYRCSVKQGDLLSENDATFIVNASNTKLLLGSGVSMAFKHHCGNELQQEMNAKLETLPLLKKGDVVATSSGNATNFSYALHAAIMDYNQGVRGEDKMPMLEDIAKALHNIESYLQWYAKQKSPTDMKLVLPLMGCGVGGLDKVFVIELYREFFTRDIPFECEVIIYGYSKEDFTLIKSVFESL